MESVGMMAHLEWIAPDLAIMAVGVIVGLLIYYYRIFPSGNTKRFHHGLAERLKTHYVNNTLPSYVEEITRTKKIESAVQYPVMPTGLFLLSLAAVAFWTRVPDSWTNFVWFILLVILDVLTGITGAVFIASLLELFYVDSRIETICEDLQARLPAHHGGDTEPMKTYIVEFLVKYGGTNV